MMRLYDSKVIETVKHGFTLMVNGLCFKIRLKTET